jgi:hypothetical protein
MERGVTNVIETLMGMALIPIRSMDRDFVAAARQYAPVSQP